MVEYRILEIALHARNLAASRSPRLQPSVPAEFGDMVSREVAAGDWSIDPKDGEAISAKGQTIAEHLEFCISTRPHWLMPVVKEDPTDEIWAEANITKRAARLKHLRAFTGSDAAALVLLKEEALLYGITDPFSKQTGAKIDPKKPKSGDNAVSPSNAWGDEYVKRHGQDAAYAERARQMKVFGLKKCTEIAFRAGKHVTGAKL